jgi:hypothetical protein
MTVVVRPLESTDSERDILRLRFPNTQDIDSLTRLMDRQSRRSCWLESHPLADRMYRWIVDAEGEIVGHLAALPQYYRINGQRVVAHTPADYMVAPGYGFHAITLMRKFFRTCENCVACDTVPAAIGVETRLGAEEVGSLQSATKLWNIASVRNFPTSVPVPVARLFNRGLQAVDRGLMATTPVDHLRVEVLEGFDETFDELFESVTAAVPCVPEKDAAFLGWRYGPASPQSPVTILGVREGGILLGYAVLRVTSGGDAGYLLDLTTLPGRHDVARSLLRNAIRHFAAQGGVSIIRYRFLTSPTSPRARDLWRSGFFPLYKRRHTLLVKFADHGLHEAALDPANWSYTTGDGEATFWVR